MRRPQAGYSLVESLVCLALLAVVIVAAHDVWDEALQVMGASGRALHNPTFPVAAGHLRVDLQRAQLVGAGAVGGQWSRGALALRMPDGATVTYRRRGAALVRVVRGGPSGTDSSRAVLRRVESWRWRRVAPYLVEVRVGLAVAPDPVTSTLKLKPQDQARVDHRVVSLRVAARGRGRGGGSW